MKLDGGEVKNKDNAARSIKERKNTKRQMKEEKQNRN
jgi:hypothetical protein